jgi:MSHA pilin protein MshD
MCTRKSGSLQGGATLIELVVFIVIVGVAATGLLVALGVTARTSADPLIHKQALAIAEAFIQEVQLMPFSYCDPDDPNAATALNQASCASTMEITTTGTIGPETGEDRYGATASFDNVNDYHNYDSAGDTPAGIKNIAQAGIAGLEAYRVRITVSEQALGVVPASESLLITVTVTGPTNTTLVLDGYRTRYAPNALP